jgi:transketolase
MDFDNLKEKARYIRHRTFEMVIKAGKGHLGGSFSCLEILISLYYGGVLRFDPKNPYWRERDRLVFSKGHANNCLFVILADLGFFPVSDLDNYSADGSILSQHCDPQVPGVEIVSGSLGHGLGIASGMALGEKLNKSDHMIFVVLGDGECQEGSVWEAAMFAAHHSLDNLVAFVDRNKLGAEAYTEDTSSLEPFPEKWKAFGWNVKSVDGHSVEEISDALNGCRDSKAGRPLMIVANTVKGKGISCLENVPKAHHTLPKVYREAKISKKDRSS